MSEVERRAKREEKNAHDCVFMQIVLCKQPGSNKTHRIEIIL